MDVSIYIAEFLVNKGHVLLPGLGSFVSTYQSAQLLQDNKAIQPPRRIYSFDPEQKQNDNTLALFIAGKENIPVSVAEKEVEEFVEGCHYVLNKGKRLEIKSVGLLFLNETGKVVFELEENLVTEGEFYGLPVVKLKPASHISKKSLNFTWILIIIFIAIAAVFAIQYRSSLNQFFRHQFSSQADKRDSLDHNQDSLLQVKEDTFSAVPSEFQEDTISTSQGAVINEPPSEIQEPIKPAGEQYYIVAGAFRSEEGAKKTVALLKEKGYNSRVFGKSKQGLNLVCYDSFALKAEAVKYLDKVRAEADTHAWLMKY
jgi:hypothetical protein